MQSKVSLTTRHEPPFLHGDDRHGSAVRQQVIVLIKKVTNIVSYKSLRGLFKNYNTFFIIFNKYFLLRYNKIICLNCNAIK